MALKATPENLIGKPDVSFIKSDFDAAVWKHGYAVEISKAHRCPCEGVDGAPQFACQNCFGTGFFFINPIETVGLITGINSNTERKSWSLEKIGMIDLTIRDNHTNTNEKPAFNDKVTLIKRRDIEEKPYCFHSEVLKIRDSGTGGKFVFLTYKPQEILSAFYFTANTSPLTRITDFSINGYAVDLPSLPSVSNGVVAVRYRADIQYLVVDLPHEVRFATKKGKGGRIETQTMPMQATCRRVHLIENYRAANYDGTGTQDNTYLT